jgi:hypothetical protein
MLPFGQQLQGTVFCIAVCCCRSIHPHLAHPSFTACRKSTISLYAAGPVTAASKPLTGVCAGKTYAVQVKFPASETRLTYLTAGPVGSAPARIATKNALNTKCSNTMVFATPTGFKPSNSFSSIVTAPAAAGPWTVAVASATGGCAHFQVTVAAAKCGSPVCM